MDDQYLEALPGDMEAYRRLDAFADARLAPDPAAMRRIRAHLMVAATAFGDERRSLPASVVVPLHLAPARVPGRRLPRVATAFLAAALTLGLAVGTVAAARPGGPLYSTRLSVESLLLPASGEARADAQVVRLDERLAEVRVALVNGDAAAATAALEAYAAIVTELESQAVADPAVADEIRDDVARHIAVLQSLLTQVPTQAHDALQHALDRSGAAVDHLDGVGGGRPGDPGGKPAGGGDGKPAGGTGGAGPDDKPAKTAPPPAQPTKKPPKPEKTAKPVKTPSAVQPTPKPTATPPAVQPAPRPERSRPAPPDPTRKPSKPGESGDRP